MMNGANQFELKRSVGHAQLATTDGYMDYAQQHLAEQHKRFSPMARQRAVGNDSEEAHKATHIVAPTYW